MYLRTNSLFAYMRRLLDGKFFDLIIFLVSRFNFNSIYYVH